jgi:hypothetical protein
MQISEVLVWLGEFMNWNEVVTESTFRTALFSVSHFTFFNAISLQK